MAKVILGRKLGMTQIFNEEGKIVPVTAIEAGPCMITQVKADATDGYNAIQIGFAPLKNNAVTKPIKGHFTKANLTPVKFLREFRVEDASEFQVGQKLLLEDFAIGSKVDVIGISKGKGFAGTIKRWNMQRGPMSHGSKNHRRPASAGPKGPARVFKGKHSPGRMGGDRVTVQNLEVAKIMPEQNLLLIKGAVPGSKKALIMVRTAVKAG